MNDAGHEETFQPVAGVLAFLVPGMGHVWLGETRRGVLICAGILGLFLGGLLIGGIDVVDRRTDHWWFLLQAGNGPIAFAADAINARMASQSINGTPREIVAIGRVREAGILYGALAGMLNIMVIIDAAWHRPRGVASNRRMSDRELL